MSEIKGQLLGVILVLMVFGVVATLITTTIASMSNKITDQVNEVIETDSESKQSQMIHY